MILEIIIIIDSHNKNSLHKTPCLLPPYPGQAQAMPTQARCCASFGVAVKSMSASAGAVAAAAGCQVAPAVAFGVVFKSMSAAAAGCQAAPGATVAAPESGCQVAPCCCFCCDRSQFSAQDFAFLKAARLDLASCLLLFLAAAAPLAAALVASTVRAPRI